MMLSDVRDYIASLKIADSVYMGKLPDKQEKSIGVYNSNISMPIVPPSEGQPWSHMARNT